VKQTDNILFSGTAGQEWTFGGQKLPELICYHASGLASRLAALADTIGCMPRGGR
jgi:hypothetical protein